jgi:hypothetical protein
LALALGGLAFQACGSKTGLLAPTAQTDAGTEADAPRAEFCASLGYRVGYTSLAIYVLLDKSESMANDNKWAQTLAALGAFVDDPSLAGLGIGISYFPLGTICNPDVYAIPVVPIATLPGAAAAIKASLAKQSPSGDTPAKPALRAAIEYARARAFANPSEEVVIVMVTDGAPNGCDSSADNVAKVAAEGAQGTPQILTFVVGEEAGYQKDLAKISSAGGSGKPILIGKDKNAAQNLVNTLQDLRAGLNTCEYAIPPTGDAQPLPSDLSVTYREKQGDSPTGLPRVASAADCAQSPSAFYANDPSTPDKVVLCPAACDIAHGSTDALITVVAGCGGGDGGLPDAGGLDAGKCPSVLDFSCTPACGSNELFAPSCVGGQWTCPSGSVSTVTCANCPIVPHGCCIGDGTLSVASCINGSWVCPPGALAFGAPGCKPPQVCSALLPCAAGEYCQVDDLACGKGALAGTCLAKPSTCPSAGPAVCACGGATFPSACAAAAAGFDVSLGDVCAPPPGTFACGPLFCNTNGELCRTTLDLSKTQAQNAFACIPENPACPTGCGCNLCACPPGKACGESCKSENGAHTLTCTVL